MTTTPVRTIAMLLATMAAMFTIVSGCSGDAEHIDMRGRVSATLEVPKDMARKRLTRFIKVACRPQPGIAFEAAAVTITDTTVIVRRAGGRDTPERAAGIGAGDSVEIRFIGEVLRLDPPMATAGFIRIVTR